jgi:thiamine transport system permease protein
MWTTKAAGNNAFFGLFSESTLRALEFTLLQAFVSTIASIVIGLPGAWLVARHDFKARKLFLAMSAVPFCLPPVMVILAFVLYYGHSGILTRFLVTTHLASGEKASFLYGFWGLIFVHAFYNFPIILQTVGSFWSRLPTSREEVARTLGASRFKAFMTGTFPALFPSILQSASLVFLFCFFSFTIVLVFGALAGSTLEVDIYRAVRFSGDGAKALSLASIQTFVALLVVSLFSILEKKTHRALPDYGSAPARRKPLGITKIVLLAYSILIVIFFLGPLGAIVVQAFSVKASMDGPAHFGFDNFIRLISGFQAPLLHSLFNSLVIALSAAVLASIIGLLVAATFSMANRTRTEAGKTGLVAFGKEISTVWITTLPLAISPALLAIGWGFFATRSYIFVLIIGQASIAWPFVARSLRAAFDSLDPGRHSAARTLGASKVRAFALVDMPTIFPSIAASAAFAFSIVAGDVNIPLILGSGKFETLPLLMYRLTSAYRFNEACAVGIILALLTGIVFALKERDPNVS